MAGPKLEAGGKLGSNPCTNHPLLICDDWYRGYWLASGIVTKDTGLTFNKPDLVTESRLASGAGYIDHSLVSWAGCCRMWVRVLFLYMVWSLSICISSLSLLYGRH